MERGGATRSANIHCGRTQRASTRRARTQSPGPCGTRGTPRPPASANGRCASATKRISRPPIAGHSLETRYCRYLRPRLSILLLDAPLSQRPTLDAHIGHCSIIPARPIRCSGASTAAKHPGSAILASLQQTCSCNPHCSRPRASGAAGTHDPCRNSHAGTHPARARH